MFLRDTLYQTNESLLRLIEIEMIPRSILTQFPISDCFSNEQWSNACVVANVTGRLNTLHFIFHVGDLKKAL